MELHVISHEQQTVDELLRLWSSLVPWVDAFHLRLKNKSMNEILHIAKTILAHEAVPPSSLFINSYCSIAHTLGCGGVHLPEQQTDWKEWRERLPAQVRFGRSVHSLVSARKAEQEGMDYLMAGHIFSSASKPGLTPRGLYWLQEIVEAVNIPVIAVGGIGVEQVSSVMQTGCAGVAVISAIQQHHSPAAVARDMKTFITG